jgi:hypothetical protein
MQPIRLHRWFVARGLEQDPSLWSLRQQLKGNDRGIQQLIRRLLVILLAVCLLVTIGTGFTLYTGVDIDWRVLTGSLAIGVGGLVISLALGVTRGVRVGTTIWLINCVVSLTVGLSLETAGGVAIGVVIGQIVTARFLRLTGNPQMVDRRDAR